MRGQWVVQCARRGFGAPATTATRRAATSCQPCYPSRASKATIHISKPTPRINHLPTKQPIQPFNPACKRTLFTTTLPPILIPPTIFLGLLLGLWTWKCFWIVLLQDKLLYLSWLPPLSRSETIAAYEPACRPVQWTTQQIRSLDGTKLTVCEGRLPLPGQPPPKKTVVICYFQGNGGSTPLRLPLLSQTLRALSNAPPASGFPEPEPEVEYIITALSYRGYWTSSGRASQRGIERDAQAFLAWVMQTYTAPDREVRVVLWGHSLGSAVATTALATYLSNGGAVASTTKKPSPADADVAASQASCTPITGLIMEAPSSSVKEMLISLYPQKWLPYRYLWPFLWNHWDSVLALRRMVAWRDGVAVSEDGEDGDASDGIETARGDATAGSSPHAPERRVLPPILLLTAANDEVIPPEAAGQLKAEARRLGIEMVRTDVPGAMHTEAPVRPAGRKALVEFIRARS
ncbi:alpha/beta-hydrolase [Aspergillus fijiensis CBS 313.89]|uniref:Alpha/beta-hydrolase n=1 Tax=Aspergillus fijiensis CBS 313.89 TaxID=1448319 RepID=A0A8G1RTJ2_9EURO|nr:alpha/beta-hydrolase [Aspergillus fijiensis CBS 313.89]RAK78984.1 alpha/beta-hydrolase [Aspergillus fijiensis CBS 313.89]